MMKWGTTAITNQRSQNHEKQEWGALQQLYQKKAILTKWSNSNVKKFISNYFAKIRKAIPTGEIAYYPRGSK